MRAQEIPVKLPGKENCEAHKAAGKPKPASTTPLRPSAPEVTMLDGIAVTAHVSRAAAQQTIDLDDLDGMLFTGGGSQLPPAPVQPKPAARAPRATGGAMSKKAAAAAKRAAGAGAAQGPPKKPFFHDSSEDEDSDAESAAGDGAAGVAEGGSKHKPPPKKHKKAPPGTLSHPHPTHCTQSCTHFHH